MSVFIATEPIILDRQISGLSNWAPESHWKRHWKRPGEDKSVIVRTYKAERPSSNSEKGEMVRWWQYDMKVKPSQHGANIRPRAETGLPAPQPPVPGGRRTWLQGTALTGPAAGDDRSLVRLGTSDTDKEEPPERIHSRSLH